MKITKNLGAIVFATGLALSGCSTKTCYDLPNEERVCIEEKLGADTMTITKTDGRVIEIDYWGTLNAPEPNSVKEIKDKKTEEYMEPAVLEEAKNTIRKYYLMTTKDKVEKGLKALQ